MKVTRDAALQCKLQVSRPRQCQHTCWRKQPTVQHTRGLGRLQPCCPLGRCFAQHAGFRERQRCRPAAAWRVRASAAAEESPELPTRGSASGQSKPLLWVGGTLALLAAAAACVHTSGYTPVLQEWASQSVLGRSGFLAAFALIFLSEIGDKTFFIAALLAMKVGKWLSFTGSALALSVMTVISVGIGYAFKSVPDALKSSLPIGQYLGVALMLYFGVKTLRDAWRMPSKGAGGEELAAAQEELDEAEQGGRVTARTPWQSVVEVGTLIFLAEWGDRSMLATVALGAAHSPFGVATGAILGHMVATAIAVLGGSFASQCISEKTIAYVGGVLFLAFAVATALGYF